MPVRDTRVPNGEPKPVKFPITRNYCAGARAVELVSPTPPPPVRVMRSLRSLCSARGRAMTIIALMSHTQTRTSIRELVFNASSSRFRRRHRCERETAQPALPMSLRSLFSCTHYRVNSIGKQFKLYYGAEVGVLTA